MPVLAILAGIAIMGPAAPAEASFQLQLSTTSGGPLPIVTDDGALDQDILFFGMHVPGVINYNTTAGNFFLTVTTGQSKPLIGTPGTPHMDLQVAATKISGSAADTLTIKLTDTDWTPTPTTLNEHIGGTLSGSISKVTAQAFTGVNGPPPFDTSGDAGTLLSFTSQGGFSGSGSLPVTVASPYRITMQAVITAGAGGGLSTFDFELTPAPEPATMTMALVGLPILGFMVHRSRRRRAAA
jgi:hypothetical protein